MKLLLLLATTFALNCYSQNKNESEKYERSSLYTLMVTKPGREYEDDIKNYFEENFISEKFNTHNLRERFISGSSLNSRTEEKENVTAYLNDNKIANMLIAKWFNRSKKGGFDLEMLKSRSFYNAQFQDVALAKNTLRGLTGISDGGSSLIDNTFVLVLDSRYTNKEEVAKSAKSTLGMLGSFGVLGGLSGLVQDAANLTLDTFGKGFVVATNAHLFKLVWNEEVEARFYELWATDKDITPEKRAAFDAADFFKLEYIGTDKSYADVQSTSLTTKTNSELIGRTTIKSIDHVITKLQANYDVFKTKSPLFSVDPLTCKIGLKEGLTKKTKFEILEKVLSEKGEVSFEKIGAAKIDTSYEIWDNRYGADEENPNQGVNATHLKLVSGKNIQPGMLIRQIK